LTNCEKYFTINISICPNKTFLFGKTKKEVNTMPVKRRRKTAKRKTAKRKTKKRR